MSFLHVQGILELGAGVSGMKAFLVDGVIRVELNHQRISCRVDLFQWLRKGQKKTRGTSGQLAVAGVLNTEDETEVT